MAFFVSMDRFIGLLTRLQSILEPHFLNEEVVDATTVIRNTIIQCQNLSQFAYSNSNLFVNSISELRRELEASHECILSLDSLSKNQKMEIISLLKKISHLEEEICDIKNENCDIKNENCDIKNRFLRQEEQNCDIKNRFLRQEEQNCDIKNRLLRQEEENCDLRMYINDINKDYSELRTYINDIKTRLTRQEEDNYDLRTYIRKKEERGIIRTIALNLEFEIKHDAFRIMDKEASSKFYKGLHPTDQDIFSAKLHEVMMMLRSDQKYTILKEWFGDDEMDTKYLHFVDASSYMKEDFIDDAHPTTIGDKKVSLDDAVHLVVGAKMRGERRKRPGSPYTEKVLKETVIKMITHLDELRQQHKCNSLLF